MKTDCIEWQMYRNKLGYGVQRVGRKTALAHRVSWEKVKGPIPDGLCVLHRCDNPPCTNVDHLFLGTRVDNNRDCNEKGRRTPPAGLRNRGVKITPEAVNQIRALRGTLTQREIGKRFGLKDSQMSRIMRGQSWKGIQ